MENQDSSQSAKKSAVRILPLIDLTSLGDDDQAHDIDALCDAASTPFGSVAAVCVWPRFVAQAVERLGAGPIKVAAVANFPEGSPDINRATVDASRIVAAGGTEIDVVYPWQSLIAGDLEIGQELVAATREAVGQDVLLKVILETGELPTRQLVLAAARGSIAGGADFLKTSTGKTQHSASPAAVRCLLQELALRSSQSDARPIGVKVSGGVGTVAQAEQYLELADELMGSDWCTSSTFRFGASALLGDVTHTLAGVGPA